jgi:nitrate reductase beta subunit
MTRGTGTGAKKQKKTTKRNLWSNPLFPFPLTKMRSLQNAVADTVEELELDEFMETHIQEVLPNYLYHVTFQDRRNGNKRTVISVRYSSDIRNLLDDVAWEGEIDVNILERHGMSQSSAQVLMELLAISLDEDYYDSDSDEESDSETLSQPRTPPLRSSRPLVPRLQLPQRDLP